jgi:hypothetical protein
VSLFWDFFVESEATITSEGFFDTPQKAPAQSKHAASAKVPGLV